MRIGLIDVDGHSGFPNLALMRLSAWHKLNGDSVEWWNGFCHYDRVYMSKVFTFSPDINTVISADEIIRSGTGYKNYGSLPEEIEKTRPDYSIYPNTDHAIGLLTRGCCRCCPWCIVPKKEGQIRAASTWTEVKRADSRKIVFMDNNVLASEHGLQQIDAMRGQEVWVDFNQDLDARLITPETARLLAGLKWIGFVQLSCDTPEMLPVIEQAVAYMREAGIAKSRFWAYMLVRDAEEAERRAVALDRMGVTPFAQPYQHYDREENPLYPRELLQELLLGLHSMCRGAESKFFNGHTNITSSRFLVFGVKGLLQASASVKNAMLFNILSYLSDRLLTVGNTVATLDELYIWLSNLTTIEYIRNTLKRVRKKESALILASQNLEDCAKRCA